MENGNVVKKKSIFRRILAVLGWGVLAVIAFLIGWHFVWKYSGSSKWERAFERDGVTLYTMKVPGYTIKRFKAVTRVKTTMNRAVAAMASTDTEDCAEWAPGCESRKAIQTFTARNMEYTHLFYLPYPGPLQPREFLIHAKVSQEPATKAVFIDFQAAPDALPRDKCCYRVEDIHNTWRFTPLQNGEVEVEATVNTDSGLPYPMVNRFAPYGIAAICHNLQAFLDKPKWQNARFETIQEK